MKKKKKTKHLINMAILMCMFMELNDLQMRKSGIPRELMRATKPFRK